MVFGMGGTSAAEEDDDEPPDTVEPVWVMLAVDIAEPGTVYFDILEATVTMVSGELCDGDGWQNSNNAAKNATYGAMAK
jgi:hypothetical protein